MVHPKETLRPSDQPTHQKAWAGWLSQQRAVHRVAGAASYRRKQDQCLQGRHTGHQANRPHVATAGAVNCCVLGVGAVGVGKALSSASPRKLQQAERAAAAPGVSSCKISRQPSRRKGITYKVL